MSGNVRVITTFQFVCPVTTNGVVSTTTLPIGASALPRAIRPTNSAGTTQVGGGSASLTTSLPSEKMPTAFPSATPVTTTILTTLPNGEVSTIVTATMLPPLTTATRTVGIIPFTTTLTVDTFPTPRPVDLDAYLPAYAAKGDGSLITPLYVQSSTNEHIRIFITGALLMLFIRNIFTSIDYLRRTSSRDRTLFWLLLISQLWGPVRFIPVAAGFFNRTADCKAIQIVSYTALEISYSILITFILGMKAYRCLERSKVVLAVVATLQVAAYALYIIGLPSTSVTRELSGDCLNTSTTPFIMAGISVQFVETLFIFLCFLYAVIKSSRRSATQGRMSIALSSVAGIASVVAPITSPQIGETNKPQGTKEKRGWWDYVPDSHVSIGVGGLGGPRFLPENQPSNNQEAADEHAHPVGSWRAKNVSAIWKRGDAPNIQSRPVSPGAAAPRKSSIRGDEPIPHPNRGAFGTLSEKQLMGLGANANHMPDLALVDSRTGLATGIESARTGSGARSRGKTSRGARSITEQTFSGIMRMPKMILLRAVMKDELLYTAMIALTCVLSSIGLVLGAAQSNLLFGGAIWLEINWAVVSLLVMRSYAQVIARQERDAVLQDPSAWNVAIRTEDGLGRSPILRRGAADYGFARAQRVPPSFVSRRSDISSRAFYPSPTRRPNTLSVSDYGSAVERARRADESRPSVQPLPATDPDDPFSEFERIVDMPRARDREPGSPVPSSLHGVQTWHDDDEPGPSDSVSQVLGPRRSVRGPPPTVPRRGALTDYSIDIGTMSMMGIVPQKSIDRGLPSPHGSGSRDSSAYEPSFIEAFPETPIEPRITHS
ncbi:unnamed protein product [Rhizoctonia solani]|uniref:Transmembrane protein, putative n=1 Tax=Rhizoctonia solani AG-3 Rhs1AP TaxID=1086054 RepID=X8IX75_9AGAM|nr:transmembrane protein, putative [Rhizoctonia solani AG-3 Rhs1AP]CAE6352264.1 unnamed protein product [Rhizoctonia solani]